MGKVEEFVKKREQEKHIHTEEYIDLLRWYAESMNKLLKQHAEDVNNLNEAFNARIKELKEEQA